MLGRRHQGRGGVTVGRTRTARSPLAGAIETLVDVEDRIRSIEDALTSGDALELPRAPQPQVGRDREDELQMLEAALLVGTIARRMSLRLGAIERALDRRSPLGLNETIPLRSPKRLKALQAAEMIAFEDGSRLGGSVLRPRAN